MIRCIAKVKAGESLTEQEEDKLAHRLNQPQKYFNEDNLRRAYRKPGGNLVDFIRDSPRHASRSRAARKSSSENFRAWLVSKNFTPEQAQYLSLLKNRGLVKGKVSSTTCSRHRCPLLNAADIGIEMFGEKGLQCRDRRNQPNRAGCLSAALA